jgi:hypothetical protein
MRVSARLLPLSFSFFAGKPFIVLAPCSLFLLTAQCRPVVEPDASHYYHHSCFGASWNLISETRVHLYHTHDFFVWGTLDALIFSHVNTLHATLPDTRSLLIERLHWQDEALFLSHFSVRVPGSTLIKKSSTGGNTKKQNSTREP